MRPVVLRARALAAAGAALALAGCGSGSSSSQAGAGSEPAASPPHTIATGSQTAEPSPSESAQGSPADPVAAAPVRALLEWTPVPGSTENLVTVGSGWTLSVPAGATEARLRGPHPRTIRAGDHFSVTDAFLDDTHALIVSEDRLAEDPDHAVLVDLASGRTTTYDGRSDPPTVVGGSWALGPDTLVHATSTEGGRRYCLATVDLADGSGTTGWCAPPRHGFRSVAITADGTSMLTFDDHRPSCRTPVQVTGHDLTALPGVLDCKGWDSVVLDGTTVWSVVRNEHRIEVGHFYAHTDAGWFDLGSGTTGSLVPCAGSAFFVRDPDSRSDPATLMRWSPDTHRLTIAYETRATGKAFLSPPRCGGGHLTVTAYSQGGDEQVTTGLG